MKFGKILTKIINENDLTITKISRSSGVDRTLIYRIITYETDLIFDTAMFILGGAGYKLYLTTPDNETFNVLDFQHCMKIMLLETKLSIIEFAEHVGRSKGQVRKYVHGEISPRFSTAIDILEKAGYCLNAWDSAHANMICLHQE